MKFLHEPIEYNQNGFVIEIMEYIWVKGCKFNHLSIPIIPRVEGWAYIDDVTTAYIIIEYKHNGRTSKGWSGYSRIK